LSKLDQQRLSHIGQIKVLFLRKLRKWSEKHNRKKKGYDQARDLGPALILEKLSSAGETLEMGKA